MKAVDTNVLARFFVDDPDDPESAQQRACASDVLSGRCFIPATVVLELEWVLRGFYEFSPQDVERVLRALLGVEHWVVEDRGNILEAISFFAAGLDFADAMHLARSRHASAMLTFDRRFAKRAAASGSALAVECIA